MDKKIIEIAQRYAERVKDAMPVKMVVQWCKISPEFKKVIQPQLQSTHKAALL